MCEEEYEYRFFKDCDCDVVTAFMVEHFVGFEPISTHLKLTPKEGEDLFGPYMKNALWQGVSIGVYHKATGELVGIRINLLGENQAKLPPLPYDMNEQTLNVRMFNEVLIYLFGADISVTLDTTNYMELFIVSVRQDHGHKGITTELYKRSEKIARDRKIDFLPVVCTNAYTLRATTNLGYEVRKQIPYVDYVDPITGKKIFETMKKPHVLLSMCCKTLTYE